MPVTINTPPTAAPERISRLIERINAGEIKIPKFQRGFVWQRSDVLSLLESILQGYPIGSLLLWRTEQKLKSERDIEGFVLPPTQDKYPTNYVLDGQQRLTTIYGVLSYKEVTNQTHILSVVYDLQTKEVRHRQPTDPYWCLPLNTIFDYTRFDQFRQNLITLPNSEEIIAEALRVVETFREYQIPVVMLTEKTLEEVCPIFELINSTGRKLTMYDLMVAKTFTENFDLNDEVESLAESLKSKNFSITGDSVLRILSAVRGQSVKKKAILALGDVNPDDLRESLKKTKRALEKAIDFLRSEVRVISSDFLPYDAQLTVLSKIFSLQKSPLTPEQRATIRGWFWLSSFHERYRGATDSILDGDIERCQPFITTGGPFIPMRKIEEQDLLAKEFRRGSAITHAYIALLASCNPLGLIDGAPIDIEGSLAWENQREFHHVFPKGYLVTFSEDMRKRQNDIANIILLPSAQNKQISSERPSLYINRLKDQHGVELLDRILATNLIPSVDESALLLDDFEYFLAIRLEFIIQKINEFAALNIATRDDRTGKQ